MLADKAYSHPSTRKNLRERRISHTIPERCDQIRRRKTKGSDGGRPPAFDKDRYRERNTVERGFGRLKSSIVLKSLGVHPCAANGFRPSQ
nr:hypothetical protein GCM10017611_03470 [Rhodococcus wratislaviensis]